MPAWSTRTSWTAQQGLARLACPGGAQTLQSSSLQLPLVVRSLVTPEQSSRGFVAEKMMVVTSRSDLHLHSHPLSLCSAPDEVIPGNIFTKRAGTRLLRQVEVLLGKWVCSESCQWSSNRAEILLLAEPSLLTDWQLLKLAGRILDSTTVHAVTGQVMLIVAEQRPKACDVPGVLSQVLRFLILVINYYWPQQIREEKIKENY